LAPYKTPTDLNNYKLLNVKTFGGSNNDNNDDDDEYNHFFFHKYDEYNHANNKKQT